MKKCILSGFLLLLAVNSHAQKSLEDIGGFTMGIKTNALY